MSLVTPAPIINRDRWGRPLIIPPGGGKPVAYTRATVFVDCLDDKSNLSKWQQRQVLLGVRRRPDLMLQVEAAADDDRKLQAIADEAMQAAGAHSKADIGTALHALTERVDAGGDISTVPAEYRNDLDAYAHTMRGIPVVSTEMFTVLDQYQVGGTHDRQLSIDGSTYIADVKTGRIDYALPKISMQLAVYAHSQTYDPATGARGDLDVRTDKAVIIHLPAGEGRCELVWIDISEAWNHIDLCAQVRAWRKRRVTRLEDQTPDPIELAINRSVTEEELIVIWALNESRWTPQHTNLAVTRKAAISAAATAATQA